MNDISRKVGQAQLDALGLEQEKPKAEPRRQPEPRRSGYDYTDDDLFSRPPGGRHSNPIDDVDVPDFLKRGNSYAAAKAGADRVTSSAGSPRKHTGERTALSAPHSYTRLPEPIKVGTSTVKEAAEFSPAALTAIVKDVHNAMADALQKHRIVWTSQVAMAMKDMIRQSMKDGCLYMKDVRGGGHDFVALKESEGVDDPIPF